MEIYNIIIIILLIISIVLLIYILTKRDNSAGKIKQESEETRKVLSEELQKNRMERSQSTREDRQEQHKSFQALSSGIFDRWSQRNLADTKRDEAAAQRISNVSKDNEVRMTRLEETVSKRLEEMRKNS